MATTIIQTYICKHLLLGVALVALVSATLFFIVSIILWSPGLVESGWRESAIFLKVFYAVPWFLSTIYPAIVAVGTLITLTFLAQNNEITVLRSVGLSKIDFINIILVPGIILALFGFFLISFFSPMVYELGQKINSEPAAFHSAWLKEKNNIIYVEKMKGNQLYNIRIFNLSNSGIKKFYIAKEGVIGSASALHSVLVNHYKNSAVTQRHIPELTWPKLFPNPNQLGLLSVSQRGLTLFQIANAIKAQKKMGLDFKNDQLRLWKMILLPIFTLILMIAMIPFAFHEQRSKNIVSDIILGVVISIVFYYCNQTAWSLMVLFNLPIFLGAMVAPAFIIIVCSLLI